MCLIEEIQGRIHQLFPVDVVEARHVHSVEAAAEFREWEERLHDAGAAGPAAACARRERDDGDFATLQRRLAARLFGW